jgi:hypothetical protein
VGRPFTAPSPRPLAGAHARRSLILSLIDLLPPSPIAGPEDPDRVGAVGESDRQNSTFDPAEAVVSLLARAVRQILCDDTTRIGERELRSGERYSVSLLVLPILPGTGGGMEGEVALRRVVDLLPRVRVRHPGLRAHRCARQTSLGAHDSMPARPRGEGSCLARGLLIA